MGVPSKTGKSFETIEPQKFMLRKVVPEMVRFHGFASSLDVLGLFGSLTIDPIS